MNVSLKNISKVIARQPVLENISVTFGAGEISAIVGLKGSGKSALLRVIAGAISQDTGDLEFGGETLPDSDYPVFYLPHTPPLIGDETVLRNISRFLTRYHCESDPSAVDRVMKRIEDFGLSNRIEAKVDELQDSEKQNVGYAILDAVDAPVSVLDQPFSSHTSTVVSDLLTSVASRGRTVIYTASQIDPASTIADQICLINKGKWYGLGSPAEIARMAESDHLVSRLIGAA